MHVVETTFRKGYVAHAPMEPHAAMADGRRRQGDGLGVDPDAVPDSATRSPRRSACAAENVRVITPFVGGGFGGKSAGRQAIEAARLAQAMGRPVQVAWTRDEEFFYDTFDPAAW